jgi:putative hydrolase of the HAD superfamily
VGVEKPHPRIFERALSDLEAEPAGALHVGDSLRQDVEGALAVGMEALLLVRPQSAAGHRVRETGEGGGDLADLSPLPQLVEVSRAGSPFEVGPARP